MDVLFNKCIIRDGINLFTLKTDKFKTSVLKLSIAFPSNADDRETALFSLMINVLRCGTERYPEKSDIIKRLGDLYDASCSMGGYASGDNRILEISSEMLSDRFSSEESILNGVTELMDQLIYHPFMADGKAFPSDTVEREKKVLCDKIKSAKNNSREYAFKRCREIMCDGEPYGCSVKIECLNDITSAELTEYYKTLLSRAELCFSYVGDEDIGRIAEILRKHFGNELIGVSEAIKPLSCRLPDKVRSCDEDLDIKQGVLVLGFKSGILLGDKYSDAMRVFNNIFGGTATSRLFTVIREKMGLCYYCDSDYVSTKGLMFVSSGIDVDDREKVQSEIINQLELLKTQPVSDGELSVAKDLAVKELKELFDYQAALATYRYSYSIYGLDCDINEKIEDVKRITAEDIREIANMLRLDTVFFLKGNREEDESDD